MAPLVKYVCGIALATKMTARLTLPSKQGVLSKQVLLWSCLQNKVCFQWEGISPKHRQTSKPNCYSLKTNSFCLSTVTPCRIGVPWPGPAVLKYQGKHDDIVLVQLELTQLAKCSPFPMNGFPGWLALGGSPMAGADQTGRTGLDQSDRTDGLTCFSVGRPHTSDFLTGNCLVSNSMVWANITNLQWKMRITLPKEDDLGS